MSDEDFAALMAFAIAHGFALFPIPAGRKAPVGIVHSFAKDWSKDPEQWKRWRAENPGCNFGVACGASGLILVDVDVRGGVLQWETFAIWWREKSAANRQRRPCERRAAGCTLIFVFRPTLTFESGDSRTLQKVWRRGPATATSSRRSAGRKQRAIRRSMRTVNTSCFATQLTVRRRLSLSTANVSIGEALLSVAASAWRLTDIPSTGRSASLFKRVSIALSTCFEERLSGHATKRCFRLARS